MAFKKLSVAAGVTRGYGQVEPNHLSAQRTGEIYAQLPAAADIKVLENGQFVKYDYSKKVVDFTGRGEWMLVYNEIKVYRDRQSDEDFALVAQDYEARVYSPVEQNGYNTVKVMDHEVIDRSEQNLDPIGYAYSKLDIDEHGEMMPEGTSMVPRVFKTHEGDIFTTNTVNNDITTLALGDLMAPNATGYLEKVGDAAAALPAGMVWEVVKIYTLPDGKPAVKVMRVQ